MLSPRGQTNLKVYSAAGTGYQHLNKEEMISMPEHVKEDL